jgi:AmiR/NasT family two-component response regulator
VAIEQAKGMLAERAKIDMAEAFGRLRAFASASNRRLTDVVTDMVSGTLSVDAVGESRRGGTVKD